jgi:hypothetical protein
MSQPPQGAGHRRLATGANTFFVDDHIRRGPGSRQFTPLGAAYLALPHSVARRCGGILLRGSLALIFIWFGALKVTGTSPQWPRWCAPPFPGSAGGLSL